MTAAAAPATTTFKTLANFDGTENVQPEVPLVQAIDGNFYGTTIEGGPNNCGTIFKITPGGKLTIVYSFGSVVNSNGYSADGVSPSGLTQATNGDLYGTTGGGGNNGVGTFFRFTLGGKLTTIYSFCAQPNCTDGAGPTGIIQATDGNFYGTTGNGGTTNNTYCDGCGTVFKITAAGVLTSLHSFNGMDGDYPTAGLVQATNGDFYGTTSSGGPGIASFFDYGTVFKITTGGKLTTLHNFCPTGSCTEGVEPLAGLIQASNGDFYGTASEGGANGGGTVFEITPGGKLTTVYNFCTQMNCADGSQPYAGLIQATDGNLYGTTVNGGAHRNGEVFQLTTTGMLATLHSFCAKAGCPDGQFPHAGLIQSTNGSFYGTTTGEGDDNTQGTIFSLSVGLGPFIETLTTSGKVGASVIILGNDLTGVTSVTFNGATAVFTIVSASEIKTTVPTGATTGTVEVTTPSGTLSSNVPYQIP